MAPKSRAKKSAPPAPPVLFLQGCNIAFVKLTAAGLGGISKATLESDISAKGGAIVSKINDCTHLIAEQVQYQKKLARVKEAIAKDDVHIVTFEWLSDCIASASRLDESKYSLHSRNTDAKDSSDDETDAKSKMPVRGKRARTASKDEDDDDDDSTTNKKVKTENTQPNKKQTTASINVPLDEGLLLEPNHMNYKVVIGDDGTIYDVTLNQTNSGNNNNKFYRIQLLADNSGKHWCWTRWGRVGERGQMKMLGDGDYDVALKEFGKKFKDKNGNSWEKRLDPIKSGKYSYIERSYEDSEDESEDVKTNGKASAVKDEDDAEAETPVESKLPEAVQRLMKLIFNKEYFDSTLASLDYDANKMPLGKLSKNTLLRGYEVLKDLTNLMSSGTSSGITDRSNQYFSLIPHAFGRNRPPILNNMPMIKKEIELLESLTDMQLANDIMKNAAGKKSAEEMNILDRQYQGLGMQEMTPVKPKSTEFIELQNYLTKSTGHTHGLSYKVQDIFRIERQGEHHRYDTSKFANIPNTDRRLLWHGSRCTNFGGILSQGLRIAPPEAPVNGYMFGKGVYLADMSSKSANYCCAYNSGGIGLLLLCEAELGAPPLKLTNANSNAAAEAAKQGAVSTWGVGMTAPQGWKDAGCIHDNLKGVLMPDVVKQPPGATNEQGAYLQYNEYIVYDVAQVKLRYLLRCQIN